MNIRSVTVPSLARRSLMRGALAASAAVLTFRLPAMAAPAPHPDARLMALWDAYQDACDAEDEAVRIEERLFDEWQARSPERPDVLLVRPEDQLGVNTGHVTDHDGVAWYSPAAVDHLRTKRQVRRIERKPQPGEYGREWQEWEVIVSGVPCPERQARAAEIVAAYDAWKAEDARVQDEIGLAAQQAESARCSSVVYRLEREIITAPARGLEGLAVKALVLQRIAGGTTVDDPEGMTEDRLRASMMRDILGGFSYAADHGTACQVESG